MRYPLYVLLIIITLFFGYGERSVADGVVLDPQTVTGSETGNHTDMDTISLTSADYLYSDLSSILSYAPGLQTQAAGATGSYSSFWLRGSSAKSVNVYLDGLKINDPISGGLNLSTIPIWSLSRINIFKSDSEVAMSGAGGTGSIELQTRDIENHSQLKLSTGSFSRNSASFSLSRDDMLLSAEIFNATNDFPYIHSNQTKANSNDDYHTKRKNNNVKRQFLLVKDRSQYETWVFNSLIMNRDYQSGVSSTYNKAESAYLKQITTRASSKISNNNFSLTLSYSLADHIYDDLNDEIGLSADRQSLDINTSNLGIEYKFNPAHLKSSIGLNVSTSNIDGQQISNSSVSHLNLEKENIEVNQSIVFDDFSFFYSAGINKIESDKSDYLSYGMNHKIFEMQNSFLSVTLSKKVRLPTTSELFINQGNMTSNPELNEERFYELNLKYNLANPIYGATLEGFYRESKDTIIVSYDARGIGRASNQGRSKIIGLEGSGYYALNSETELQLSTTLLNSKNLNRGTPQENKFLPSFHHISYQISFIHIMKKTRLAFDFQGKSGLYYNAVNTAKAPDQYNLNLSLSQNFKAGTIGIKVNNLLDKQYTGFKTEPLPGINYLLTLQIDI